MLTRLPNGPEVREYLAEFATTMDVIAYRAVGLLGHETGPEGLARLRRLFEEGGVARTPDLGLVPECAHVRPSRLFIVAAMTDGGPWPAGYTHR